MDPDFKRIRVRPISGALGAEIDGADLGQPHEQLGLLGLECLEILLRTKEAFELSLGLGGIGLDGLQVRSILSGQITD